MKDVKKILVGLCLSPHAKDVFNQAAQLAESFNAEIIALNVLNIRDVEDVSSIESLGYNVKSDDYRKTVKEERREEISKIIEESGFPSERAKIVITVGHPVEKILEYIKEENADLVVMGAKGKSNLTQLLVGSVAEKIFRHSPVTVISYRDKTY